MAGACLVLAGAIAGSGQGERLGGDLPWMAVFAAAGLVLAALAAALLDRAYLPGGHGRRSCAGATWRRGSPLPPTGVACGIIAGNCLYGADLETLAVGAAFFALGVATLLGVPGAAPEADPVRRRPGDPR